MIVFNKGKRKIEIAKDVAIMPNTSKDVSAEIGKRLADLFPQEIEVITTASTKPSLADESKQAELVQANADLLKQVEELTAKLGEVGDSHSELEADLEKATADLAEAKSKVEELTKENADLNELLESASASTEGKKDGADKEVKPSGKTK